jgi:hypothetical protein
VTSGRGESKGGVTMDNNKKGLCSTCANDKTCTFPRKFPVIQCVEFTVEEPEPTKPEKIKIEEGEI